MAARSTRARDILLPLMIVVILAAASPFVRAQAGLLTAESASTSASASTKDAAKSDINLWAYLRAGKTDKDNHVDLYWRTEIGDVVEFHIQRAPHGSHEWTDIKTMPGSASSFSDLDAKTLSFDYRVTAIDYGGGP